jgi:aspartyl/asparaginyl beta-hydroxylase (cupin superfamily)
MAAGGGEADLFARAAEAWQQGRRADSTALLETIVAADPRHLAALNTLAMIALNSGDAAGSLHWLERAVAVEPKAAPIWFNLYQAHDLAGDSERGMASLDRALELDPYYVPAVLMKADLLHRLGRTDDASAMFRAILAVSPKADALPEPARRALATGIALVEAEDAARAAAIAGPLAAVRAAFPEAKLDRAMAYAEQRTGRRKVYVQQPIGGHFPYLPAIEFFAPELFPWFAALEAKTTEIREELLAVLGAPGETMRPYVAFDATQPVNQWAELNHSRRWSAFFFWEDGERHAANCARCPVTAALLETLPLLDLPGRGPTAMFSILEPKTRIPPHTGSNNVRTTVHLPLVVPAGCGFRVGAETRSLEAGRAWAFDDTIEHEAWNDSDAPRAILILDTWNPLLTEAERAAVRVIA